MRQFERSDLRRELICDRHREGPVFPDLSASNPRRSRLRPPGDGLGRTASPGLVRCDTGPHPSRARSRSARNWRKRRGWRAREYRLPEAAGKRAARASAGGSLAAAVSSAAGRGAGYRCELLQPARSRHSVYRQNAFRAGEDHPTGFTSSRCRMLRSTTIGQSNDLPLNVSSTS